MTDIFPTPPVLLLAFNRPERTGRVLAEIGRAAPEKLFVALDGPRAGNQDDQKKCTEVRDVVESGIHWKSHVEYLIRERNLGCRTAVAAAISWFFDNVEEGIILEDDCLPVQQFFPFCASLLNKYRDEPRVAQIGGFNCQFGRKRGSASYYFSRYFHCWGWASWRRAWNGFDVDMKDYAEFLAGRGLERLFSRRSIRDFWKDNFDDVAFRNGSTWDYQWVYQNFKRDRLAVVPNWNMILNMGFGGGATHTETSDRRTPVAASDIPVDIVHPSSVDPCDAADDFTYRHQLGLGVFHDLKQVVKRRLGFRRTAHV
jgi:hypothetical protein